MKRTCIYCGNTVDLTKDHIPPKLCLQNHALQILLLYHVVKIVMFCSILTHYSRPSLPVTIEFKQDSKPTHPQKTNIMVGFAFGN